MAQMRDGPLPDGLRYVPAFISPEEEQALLARIAQVPFREVKMRGQVARRRTAHYGWDYGYESWEISPTTPVPAWLLPLRERAAALINADPRALGEVLISEYPPGAGIGWHRDAPMFGPAVIGVSLRAPCRMRLQRGRGEERRTAAIMLEPRSAYVLSGEARSAWQHSIPDTKELRYSITFRTLRDEPAVFDLEKGGKAGTPESPTARIRTFSVSRR
jgi:alkylated DNA repair dioxygenase AlkB